MENHQLDMNVVMTESGKLIEVQGTAEEVPFDRSELNKMLDLAQKGLNILFEEQRKVIGTEVTPKPSPKSFGSLAETLDNALKKQL